MYYTHALLETYTVAKQAVCNRHYFVYKIPRVLNYNHKCSKAEASRVSQTEELLPLTPAATPVVSCCPMRVPAAVPQLPHSH